MDKTIHKLILDVGNACKKDRLSLVTVESCTGGGIAFYISALPESSSILERGFVLYSNQAKEEISKVTMHTLQLHGAVSEEVAKELAEGGLNLSKAHICVATTGLAGPDNENKEDGIVWIACAGIDRKTIAYKKNIPGSREKFMHQAIVEALKQILHFI